MLFDLAGGAEGLLWPMKVLLAALVMTPPALLMGASFPYLVRAAVGSNEGALGQPVGQVYGANTLGSIFGSFAAGFVLLPLLRVTGAVSVANAANVLAAFVAGAFPVAGFFAAGFFAAFVAVWASPSSASASVSRRRGSPC